MSSSLQSTRLVALWSAESVAKAAVQAWRKRTRLLADLRQLHAMDDHELADVGLARSELPALPPALVLGDDWRSWHRA